MNKLNNQPAGGLTAEGSPAGGIPVGGIPIGGILGGLRGILPAGGFPTDGIWNNKIPSTIFACMKTLWLCWLDDTWPQASLHQHIMLSLTWKINLTSCYSNGSNRPHCHRCTDHVFTSWHQYASSLNTWFLRLIQLCSLPSMPHTDRYNVKTSIGIAHI